VHEQLQAKYTSSSLLGTAVEKWLPSSNPRHVDAESPAEIDGSGVEVLIGRVGPQFELASAQTTLETRELVSRQIGGEAATIARDTSSHRACAAQFLSATACWDEADQIKYLGE
jgi:hypothetical protein